MTRATYNADNTITELPELAEPLQYQEWLACVENDKIFVCVDEQGNDIIEYHNHLSTLRTIPCDPSCRGLWKEGQEVVEGKDYEVRKMEMRDTGYPFEHCEQEFASPLPVKSEDDLWEEVMRFLKNETGFRQEYVWKMVDKLKSDYSLTKR